MQRKSEINISILLLILIIISPLIMSYGVIDDFTFRSITPIKKFYMTGYIPENDFLFQNNSPDVPGFFALGIIVMNISNISYKELPYTPIQFIPFIFIIFSAMILFYDKNKNLILLLIFIIVTFKNNFSDLSFEAHALGLLLTWTLVISIFLFYKSNNFNSHISSFIIAILCVVSTNFISYKATFLSLAFLFFIYIFELILNRGMIRETNSKSIKNIFMISFIFTFQFNRFFYDKALPVIYNIGGFDSGLSRIMARFKGSPNDLLSQCDLYYYKPYLLNYIIYIRLLFLFALLAISIFWIGKKAYDCGKKEFDLSYIIYIAIIFMGTVNLIFYNLIGLFDISMLTYSTLFSILISSKTFNSKKKIYTVLMILILINMSYQIAAQYYNLKNDEKSNLIFIEQSTNWCSKFFSDKTFSLKSDVFTQGYHNIQILGSGFHQVETIKISDALFLTQFIDKDSLRKTNNRLADELIELYGPNKYLVYIVNYDLKYLSIENFQLLKSFFNFKKELNNNKHLNEVYSSEKIAAYAHS
jgi:hypothetical protein